MDLPSQAEVWPNFPLHARSTSPTPSFLPRPLPTFLKKEKRLSYAPLCESPSGASLNTISLVPFVSLRRPPHRSNSNSHFFFLVCSFPLPTAVQFSFPALPGSSLSPTIKQRRVRSSTARLASLPVPPPYPNDDEQGGFMFFLLNPFLPNYSG